MWYLVLSRPLTTSEERRPRLQAHSDWLADQHRAGRILFSGPAAGGYGIFIVLAASRQEVEALVAPDPYHVHHDRVPEIFDWNVVRAMRLDGPSVDEIEAMARGER
jgi:uncharacterized protein YciI